MCWSRSGRVQVIVATRRSPQYRTVSSWHHPSQPVRCSYPPRGSRTSRARLAVFVEFLQVLAAEVAGCDNSQQRATAIIVLAEARGRRSRSPDKVSSPIQVRAERPPRLVVPSSCRCRCRHRADTLVNGVDPSLIIASRMRLTRSRRRLARIVTLPCARRRRTVGVRSGSGGAAGRSSTSCTRAGGS